MFAEGLEASEGETYDDSVYPANLDTRRMHCWGQLGRFMLFGPLLSGQRRKPAIASRGRLKAEDAAPRRWNPLCCQQHKLIIYPPLISSWPSQCSAYCESLYALIRSRPEERAHTQSLRGTVSHDACQH